LRLLENKGVKVGLLVMPVAQVEHPDPALEFGYMAYLREIARRYPNVSLISAVIPHWPAELFADGQHLTGSAARLFTRQLSACISNGLLGVCDLQFHNDRAAAQ
jgi:hypothetical protein